jgi:hypothetical protein
VRSIEGYVAEERAIAMLLYEGHRMIGEIVRDESVAATWFAIAFQGR